MPMLRQVFYFRRDVSFVLGEEKVIEYRLSFSSDLPRTWHQLAKDASAG